MAPPKKYEHIEFQPPAKVRERAEQGLALRRKQSPSNKGGLSTQEAEGIGSGVQRAVNLKAGDPVSPEVARKMKGFFSRFRSLLKDSRKLLKAPEAEQLKSEMLVADLLWGGPEGEDWINKVVRQMEEADAQEGKKVGKAASTQWKDQVRAFNEVYKLVQNTPDLEALHPDKAASLLRDLRSVLMELEYLETEVADLPVRSSKTDSKSFMFMDRTLQNMFNSLRSGNPYRGGDLWGDWRQVQAWLVTVVRRFQKDVLPELTSLGQPSSFTWNGLRVENEDGSPPQTVKAMLDGMSEGLAVLNRRGLNKLVTQSLKRIVFHTDASNFPGDAIPKDRVGGWYSSRSQSLHLLARELDPNRASRLITRWFTEVFLHELGHHIHLNVLSPEAKAHWDDAWDYLDRLRLEVLAQTSVDNKDVNAFMNAMWTGSDYADWAEAGRALKGLQRGKYLFALHHAGWSKNPVRVTVTDSGKKMLEALRCEDLLKGKTGPGAKAVVDRKNCRTFALKSWLKAMREIGFPMLKEIPSSVRDALDQVTLPPEAARDLEDWLNTPFLGRVPAGSLAAKQWTKGLLACTHQDMPPEVWQYLEKNDVTVHLQVDSVMEAMGLPTEYAKTNEKEDFAETFVLWVAAPDQLSPAQRWRMGRSLGLSAAAGKPVFDRLGKLSIRLARAFLRARLPLRTNDYAQR